MEEITLAEIKMYLYLDSDEEDGLVIEPLIEIARVYIDGMVGEDYKLEEKGIKLSNLLMRKLVWDMYNSRSTEVSATTKQDRIVSSILDKLSLYEVVI